jgi:hypothetical protein
MCILIEGVHYARLYFSYTRKWHSTFLSTGDQRQVQYIVADKQQLLLTHH